ncbi:hypothetical protein Y1Q_0011096 [Alligator mississippiensis]|uniref:Uncharacterized protein n=1 Tax=Alligator mississippiensis TaxID=8496 RepID=A0A151MS64_ALLMI|nr:hypothetical protein Y1Q_0011096 [Alligator mississippiensis]
MKVFITSFGIKIRLIFNIDYNEVIFDPELCLGESEALLHPNTQHKKDISWTPKEGHSPTLDLYINCFCLHAQPETAKRTYKKLAQYSNQGKIYIICTCTSKLYHKQEIKGNGEKKEEARRRDRRKEKFAKSSNLATKIFQEFLLSCTKLFKAV